jgi:sigma-B regulation protein RsbU (phosphoserine phosphatase)
LLRANGAIEELPRPKNTIVGAFDGVIYKEDSLQLEHGDTLVMFTDGVTEAMNQTNEEFGNERLDNILSGLTDKSCQQIVETVKAGITDFVEGAEQSDDITMLVLKRK